MKAACTKENTKMKKFYFFCQVDDFAVVATNEQTAIDLIHDIGKYTVIDIKDL